LTVNCIYITSYGTVHATDSLLVDQSMARADSSGNAKIIALPHYQGGISWFCRAAFGTEWKANDWLLTKALEFKDKSPDHFADKLAAALTDVFEEHQGYFFDSHGIGLHFTFYEIIDGMPIPELIWITNFNTLTSLGSYKKECGPEFVAQRRTFHDITKNENYAEHHKNVYRHIVRNYVKLVNSLFYHNGDILLTGPSEAITEQLIVNLLVRKDLPDDITPLKLFGKRALFRTELAALAQKTFSSTNKIAVGAPCFNLLIPSTGILFTDTPPIPGLPDMVC
jgi:hypothetical protein